MSHYVPGILRDRGSRDRGGGLLLRVGVGGVVDGVVVKDVLLDGDEVVVVRRLGAVLDEALEFGVVGGEELDDGGHVHLGVLLHGLHHLAVLRGHVAEERSAGCNKQCLLR